MRIWLIRKAPLTIVKGRDEYGELWFVCRNGRPIHAGGFFTFDAADNYKGMLEDADAN